MMASLRTQLLERSNLGADSAEPLEAMIGVPANANSNQRFLTEEAALEAGFSILGVVNEPSAAAIEFAYRNSAERKNRAGSGLLVYDLGGGTFDVSLVVMGETEHAVKASDGIPNLGGDDFDEILAALVLETAGHRDSLNPHEKRRLLDECREKKESLNPNTRKVTIDLERVRSGWQEVTIPVDTYYERCRPLIESTREMVEKLLAAHSETPSTPCTSPEEDPSFHPWPAFSARPSAAACAVLPTCARPAPSAWPSAPALSPTACTISSTATSASGVKQTTAGPSSST